MTVPSHQVPISSQTHSLINTPYLMQSTNQHTITGAVHLLSLAFSSSVTHLEFSPPNVDAHTVLYFVCERSECTQTQSPPTPFLRSTRIIFNPTWPSVTYKPAQRPGHGPHRDQSVRRPHNTGIGARFPVREEIFLFSKMFQTDYSAHQDSYSMGIGGTSPGVQEPWLK